MMMIGSVFMPAKSAALGENCMAKDGYNNAGEQLMLMLSGLRHSSFRRQEGTCLEDVETDLALGQCLRLEGVVPNREVAPIPFAS